MRFRTYSSADAAGVVAFMNACVARDPTLHPMTAQGWREFVAQSYNHDGRDFVLAEREGVVVGSLVSYGLDDLRHFRIYVHPDERRRGVGTRLLRVVEEQDGKHEQCNCMGKWPAGIAFLEHHGFTPAARSLDMARDAPPPDPAAAPDGIRLRPCEPRDDEAWIALSDEGYFGTPGYTPLTPSDLANFRAAPGGHVWMADEGGRVVGLCHTFVWNGDRPFINSVVVAGSARDRGLGRALTVAGVRTLAEQGHARVELNVRADNTPAVRIYEGLDFRTVEEVITYRRYNDGR